MEAIFTVLEKEFQLPYGTSQKQHITWSRSFSLWILFQNTTTWVDFKALWPYHGVRKKGRFVSCAGILEQPMGARNRLGVKLSYRPFRLHRLSESIPLNRFLWIDSWAPWKFKNTVSYCCHRWRVGDIWKIIGKKTNACLSYDLALPFLLASYNCRSLPLTQREEWLRERERRKPWLPRYRGRSVERTWYYPPCGVHTAGCGLVMIIRILLTLER